MSTGPRIVNLTEIEDKAPSFGMGDNLEARFVRDQVGAQAIGLSQYRMKPGKRLGFGHSHGVAEEMYVVLSGTGRFKIDDDVLDVKVHDIVFCPPDAVREWEAGPDGMELMAFGAHAEGDNQMHQGWWPEGS